MKGEPVNQEGIVVLSLFDGISCGRVALERAGIPVKAYYASEIDKHAIKVSKDNWKGIIHIGDVTKVSYKDGILYTECGEYEVGKVDLIIGGSPCQSISNLGDGSGLQGKSGLFYHFLRILGEVEPSKFLLENVSGKRSAIDEITKTVGVEPLKINSNLFSAQNRERLYWTDIQGIEVPQTQFEKNLIDILEGGMPTTSTLSPGRLKWIMSEKGQECVNKRYANIDPIKAACLTARSDASWNCNYVTHNGVLTKLSCVEYERLQTLPDNYTKTVSDSNRYKALGNGWTVDVIAHILKHWNQE